MGPKELLALIEWRGDAFEILALRAAATTAEKKHLSALIGVATTSPRFEGASLAATLYKKVRVESDPSYLQSAPLRAMEDFAVLFKTEDRNNVLDPKNPENQRFTTDLTRLLKWMVWAALNVAELEL